MKLNSGILVICIANKNIRFLNSHALHTEQNQMTHILRMVIFRGFFIWLMVFCAALGIVHGQEANLDINKKLSQYVLRSWSTEEGIASESTNEILQSDDGYIWIATYAGLHRFDGKDFTIYNAFNSNIPSPNVLRLEKGMSDDIWIGTHHGVAIYRSGEFIVPKALESTKDMSIEQMLFTDDGDLWFSTRTNNLYRYHEGNLEELTSQFGFEESTVLSMFESENGDLFFGTDDSKLVLYTKNGDINPLPLETIVNGVNAFYSRGGLIYIGTGRGLYTWNGTRISKYPSVSDKAIRALHVDQNEVIWLGTMSGLFRWDTVNAQFDSLTEASGMPNNLVRDMLFDQQGNLWVATYRNGIFFLSDGSIVSYTKDDGVETNIISSVTEIEKDTYLLGNENCTLNLLKNDEISVWDPPIPLPSARLKHLFTDSQGRIWVSTYKGLYVLDGPNSRKYTLDEGFPDNYIRVTHEDKDGNIWVGTKNAGLIRFSSLDQWDQVTLEDGLSSNYILSIEANEKGQIIVATISGLNILEKDGSIKTVTVDDGLPSNFMFSTYSTPNYIWLATNDGLTGYSETKIVNFNQENGLEVDIIYDIKKSEDGNLWMPSENSILSVSHEELEAAAADPSFQLRVKQYDKSYGMKNSHCLGAVLTLQDSRGILWIPTLGGIVKLDPDKIDPPTFEPNVIIENIEADNQKINIQGDVIIPAGTGRLLIDFTAISYVQADRLQFRYKLDPFDEDWILASSERDASYTNLPPRTYEFYLQTGIDGEFANEIVKKNITLQAAWWQTLWAKILLVLLIIAVALFIYWLRLRALTSRNIRLEKTVSERTQALELQKEELNAAIQQLKKAQEQMIQSDKMASLGILSAGVAHEINNPLNFIQGGVDVLEHTFSKNKSLKQSEFNSLIGAIKEGISRTAKIVSSLNEFSQSKEEQDQPVYIHHLIENCITMLQYRLKDGIELIKDFGEDEIVVMGNNGKIHQAFLNIMTNAMQAIEGQGFIKIKTRIEEDQTIIEFSDSGQGIKPEDLPKITEPFFSTKEPGKGTGLGLSITYSIIADHSGKLTYSSDWGKGTTARVSLPSMRFDFAEQEIISKS